MIVLTGNSLNKRHQELNTKVNEAATSNLDFEDIKDTLEGSDVDKLFKIDLASKYKNIDYILEVLISGDTLCISRALKCNWIIDDEFSQFINPPYLEKSIFPFMSRKMKHKLLSFLSSHLRNGERAEEFHHFCMRNRMYKLGMSFLLYTNESFKIEILTLHPHVYNDFDRNENYVEHFIGNSFMLAEYYLKVVSESERPRVLYKLRYLYSVSEEQYLDLLEAFKNTENHFHGTSLRLSRDIMKKYKKRVLKDPWLYLNMLNQKVVARYSTSDDAKVYAIPFLPDTCNEFWYENYYKKNNYFLNLIPLGERFFFLKKIFTEKYPGEIFEEDYEFFTYKFYEMMTVEEKEVWALRHVVSEKELHGCGNDYIWYQFINFAKAFVELKKFILIAPDNGKRSDIIKILIDSAKTQQEITIVLDYYYNRHINELKDYKRTFLNNVIANHKVLSFNDECWAALEKIFHSLEVYHERSRYNDDYQNKHYRALSLIYYIIHEKAVPEVFNDFLISHTITIYDLRRNFDRDLDPKQLDMIFQWMFQFLRNQIELLFKVKTDEALKKINRYSDDMLDLFDAFEKKEEDLPKNIRDHIFLHFEEFKHHGLFAHLHTQKPEFHIKDIMHYLKEDASLVIQNFSNIEKYFSTILYTHPNRNINWLIRKLKTYFSHDIAPTYIMLLEKCLTVEKLQLQTALVAVFGVFNLCNEEYKVNFLNKYVPNDAKIDHVNISRDLLTIQTAICSIACQSRPPLPLSSFRDYIKGDYLQYCIPIFDSYLANLTPDQCLSFIESLLDSPLSIQKHGLRLAFHCFSPENLKNLVLKVWNRTKNVSLRKILYKALFKKVDYYHDNPVAQLELFGALTIMTHDLNEDDDDEIFDLLAARLPPNVLSQHLQSAFTVVNTFPTRPVNYRRLTPIVEALENYIESISKTFLQAILEAHINTMLDHKLILDKDLKDGHNELIEAKWSLVKTVIIKHKNMHFLYLVMDKSLQMWYETNEREYIYRKLWTQILDDLENLSYRESTNEYIELNNVFKTILNDMKNAHPFKENYEMVWLLNINIITRQVLGEDVPNIENCDQETAKILVKQTIRKFSRLIGSLLKENVENNNYFPSLYEVFKVILSRAISYLIGDLNRFIEDGVLSTHVHIFLCSVLLEYKDREIQMFVMNLIPNYCDDNDKEYYTEFLGVINKLKSLDDKEIQYFMCHKFYSCDYQYRDFMP